MSEYQLSTQHFIPVAGLMEIGPTEHTTDDKRPEFYRELSFIIQFVRVQTNGTEASAISPVVATGAIQELPESFVRFREMSRAIVGPQEDLDENDARAVMVGTWRRAIVFVEANYRLLYGSGALIPLPEIDAVADGSIDLHWDLPEKELLVNVPEHPDHPLKYYGDDRRGNAVSKGQLRDGAFPMSEFLFRWLVG